MINIYLNDQQILVDSKISLQHVLEKNNYLATHIAIALNNQFIPRALLTNTLLNEGDRIDVIVPMQGG